MNSMAYTYGIADLTEATSYFAHPVLSARLIGMCEVLLTHKNNNAEYIFGYTDAMKLRSSMTLFALVSENGSVFHRVLEQFYSGKMDNRTLEILQRQQ